MRPSSLAMLRLTCLSLLLASIAWLNPNRTWSQEPAIRGVTVIPHSIASELQYRRDRDTTLSARVQLFIAGPADSMRLDGRTPDELLSAKEWSWHSFANAPAIPEGAIGVREFNGATARWGVDNQFELQTDSFSANVDIASPDCWISAVTFLGDDDQVVQPNRLVLYVQNESHEPISIRGLRLWIPKPEGPYQILWPQPELPVESLIPAHDKGFVDLQTMPLPLTYAAIELITDREALWTHLRIKKESFDISGGWIGDHLRDDAYLDLLANLHIDAGQIQEVDGYTNDPVRYSRHPIKSFNRMMPFEKFDTDEWLPRIHAVEFLGEPQYGGGRPVPPQDVFDAFEPYRGSRLATSVTHSEERVWRFYAGLSDYPHFDAYRIVAPAADSWRAYDRWDGTSIRWGAPLETIGDLTRSLRDLNRPMPIAAWSQGPHDGWGGLFDGRRRRSPNSDELRSQALHALSSRITSLYWFNLSLESLMKYPDTWDAIRRLGREMHAIEPILLSGDAYAFERRLSADGRPDWDLASVASPSASLLFALDTAYTIDPEVNEFRFGSPRETEFRFRLPTWHRDATTVVRIDADGVHEVSWRIEGDSLLIDGAFSRDAIFLVGNGPEAQEQYLRRLREAQDYETTHPIDVDALRSLSEK